MKWLITLTLFSAQALAQVDPGYSFTKPPGPPEGGTVKVPHPDAAKGLLRINKDGSYQYRVPQMKKSQSVCFKFGVMDPPAITNSTNGLTYAQMYGTNKLYSITADYEWTPLRAFGALGLNFGVGVSVSRGNGTLNDGQFSPALEAYSLYMIPMSVTAVYRFEYWRHQMVVPYILAGGTYTGLAEIRDGGSSPKFLGGASAGGGGGLHISVTRMDPEATFAIRRDYGVSDMWITLEARMMQGLSQTRDFTSAHYNAGVTVDF